jgi:hypothetical protein
MHADGIIFLVQINFFVQFKLKTDVLKPDDDSDTQQRKTRKIEEAKQLSKQLEHITRDVSDLQLEIAGAKVDPSKFDGKVKK